MPAQYITKRFVHLKDKGGVLFQPAILLDKMTEISILHMVHPKRDGFPANEYWYGVLVESGIHKGREGFLHTDDIDEYVNLASLSLITPDIRGTRYGMVTRANVDNNPSNPVILAPWDRRCTECGEASALHVLPSTAGGTSDTHGRVQALLRYIQDTIRTNKSNSNSLFYSPQKEIMIGVAEVKSGRKIFASHSGQKIDQCFKIACDALGLVYAPPVPASGNIKNRKGDLIGSDYVQKFDYQCAAPRLIQYAISQWEYPVAMTEIYAGGASTGQVIPSCQRCSKTVPYMLCPE